MKCRINRSKTTNNKLKVTTDAAGQNAATSNTAEEWNLMVGRIYDSNGNEKGEVE